MKIQLRPLWREQPVSVYDFFYLVFLLAITLAVLFYPDHPLTAAAMQRIPIFTMQSYTLVTTLLIVALAWRRWIPVVRLLLLSPPLLYTFTVLVFALPAVGKPSDFIITAVVIGWTLLFIRGRTYG